MAILHAWRYCPRCAADLDLTRAPARVECPRCGFVGVRELQAVLRARSSRTAKGRILLGRRAVPPDQGLWDILGGYLEEHEHPLDGLRRELLEETGLTIEPQRFLGVFMDTYGDSPEANATLNLIWVGEGRRRVTRSRRTTSPSCAGSRADELPAGDELAFSLLPADLRSLEGDG